MTKGKTYKVGVALGAETLGSTFHKQVNVVENKVTTLDIISLLWHLKFFSFLGKGFLM